jgi:hypothetical protein
MNDKQKQDLAQTARQIDAMAQRGAVVDVDPDDADALGAGGALGTTPETALSEQDALDSRFDHEGDG